ncbi:MAG: D-cysteine desulfhydrase family protein [Deltaproteobacteria bacterium]|nr:D-cysteine desulfhydrase family protein [Deltaproteobacteria bacterium]
MELPSLPRVSLARLPTPLHPVRRLSEALGGPEIWFKRDDETGFALGGNKVRCLEWLIGDALHQGADCLVTAGRAHSNHVRLTLAAAARFGLDGVAILGAVPPGDVRGNLRLDHLFAAQVFAVEVEDPTQLDGDLDRQAEALRHQGRKPYVIGRGGASALGCLAYVEAVAELQEQLNEHALEPQALYCATGSCCTQAGLLVGCQLLGLDLQIRGVTVSRSVEECEEQILHLAQETGRRLSSCGITVPSSEPSLKPQILAGYRGEGYGIETPEGLEAIRLVARTEGILLDPVYTGKAMAALIAEIRQGRFHPDEKVIFLHTGGVPNLLA